MNAKQSLSSISADRDLWVEQFHQEIHERDYRSGIAAAENRGRSEAKISFAKKYMDMGHTAEEAAAFFEIDVKLLK